MSEHPAKQGEPDEYRVEVVKIPMADTGIGRDMGYANDQEMVDALNAENEAIMAQLTPEARQRVLDAEADLQRRFLFGDDR
jgi:hypothetical protein